MENDGGLDDLFGTLNEDEGSQEPKAPSSEQQPVEPSADTAEASALLNAAFIEAATAPIEPLPDAGAQPSGPIITPYPVPAAFAPLTPPAATEPVSPPSLASDTDAAGTAGAAGPAMVVDDAAAAGAAGAAGAAVPMTRRELREWQRTHEDGATPPTATGAFDVSTGADSPVDEPSTAQGPITADLPRTEPVAAAPVSESSPSFDPAPELRGAEAVDAADAPRSEPDAATSVTDSDLAALAQAPAQPAAHDRVGEPFVGAAAGAASTPPAGQDARPSVVSSAPRQQAGRGFPIRLEPAVRERRRSVRWLAWFLPLVIVLGGVGATGWWAWTNYEDQIRELLGWEIPNDYTGTGNGTEVVVTILPGDFGDDVAITLHAAGVTRSFDAFYDLLLELEQQGEEPSFLPGNYRLQEEMSAQSALDALLDPANRITNAFVIPEGTTLPDTLAILAQQTGIPLEEFQAQAANFAQFGLPANAVSLEGYLYPASYELDGTETATSLLQRLVTEMFTRLDALGVAPDDRNRFLTLASIVQKESGPKPDDPPKIARVFQNRIDQGMALESDATVTYGTCVWGPTQGRTPPDTCGTVWLNQADIDDTSNPYNTRALPGLPPGPIAMPGQAALDAVAAPADGPWLFFVAVNLATGETVFSETIEEHEAAAQRLNDWCNSGDPEAASYCA